MQEQSSHMASQSEGIETGWTDEQKRLIEESKRNQEQALAALSAKDRALAEETPSLKDKIPEGWEGTEWVEPGFHYSEDTQFVLRDMNSFEEHGPFFWSDFVVDPETKLASAHYVPPGESVQKLFVLRCMSYTGKDTYECVRDDGLVTFYHLHVLNDNTLEEPELPGNMR